jgi:Domain of unknown function DUF222./HNH endonuclease.
MEGRFAELAGTEVLAVVDDALDVLLADRLQLVSDRELLTLLQLALRVDARLQAWQARLAAQVEASEAAWREHGTSTSTWLAESANLTRREAAQLVASGNGLERFATIGEAARSGAVLPHQAEAITSVLAELPADLPTESVDQAQQLMVGFATSHNSAELRRLSRHLLEVLAPETAEQREAERLERELRLAQANRHLRFSYDHHGSVLFRGSLPVVDAESFMKIIDAYASAARRGVDALDPHAEHLTPAMYRADALLAMVQRHAQQALAPGLGGDRPRIVVTLAYDELVRSGVAAGLAGRIVGTGEPIAASALRRLLCDADVLPVVLGGRSEILDVGRSQRLVTPAIRAALELRDGGCIFPGCDKPPHACQAHHLIPWWAGGRTSADNLVLVCAHHHGIVEPGHDPSADRWQARIGPSGVPEVVPPRRADPEQRPRRHARFLTALRR